MDFTKKEFIIYAVAIVLLVFAIILCATALLSPKKDITLEDHVVELVKQRIIAENGFKNVRWLSVAKSAEGTGFDATYLCSCVTYEPEYPKGMKNIKQYYFFANVDILENSVHIEICRMYH